MERNEWAVKFGERSQQNKDEWLIGDDEIDEDTRVSTVWLGLDHRFGEGPPLIFESMVFGGEYDGYARRYSTFEAAKEGHENIVLNLALNKNPEEE